MRILLAVVVLFLVACAQQPDGGVRPADPTDERSPIEAPSGVSVFSEGPCADASSNGGDTCYRLEVSCRDLAPRRATVRRFDSNDPRGTMIFSTGEDGTKAYTASRSTNRIGTADAAQADNLEVFTVEWHGDHGWATNIEGVGYREAMCAYAEVARWIHSVAQEPDLVCAQGNSGGAKQIAYGLSVYGLEDMLDMVVLSAGPPVPDVEAYCFDGIPREGTFMTDWIMGWMPEGNRCMNEDPTPEARQFARETSIITDVAEIDYTFPNTKVNFVGSEGDGAAIRAGEYFERITTEKARYLLPGEEHSIDNTEHGAEKIRELLTAECK